MWTPILDTEYNDLVESFQVYVEYMVILSWRKTPNRNNDINGNVKNTAKAPFKLLRMVHNQNILGFWCAWTLKNIRKNNKCSITMSTIPGLRNVNDIYFRLKFNRCKSAIRIEYISFLDAFTKLRGKRNFTLSFTVGERKTKSTIPIWKTVLNYVTINVSARK